MIAIILCAISSSLLAVEKPSDISSSFLIGVLQALVPHLFVAVFANVVNQVFDYEIDKDISDVKGDKAYGIDTFAIRLGQKWVFWICIILFEMAFGVALLAGATSSYLWIKIVTVAIIGVLYYSSTQEVIVLNDRV
ncbi:Putative homogentisate phytyltransferase 1, chloroplastic [Glycine soja]|uniref:Putative homogentisate phytyltransferase 1, chloroplastic n=1 Tax=Glycine soja TaxID=3848 RepID=A0A0B2R4I1_GLYSO|nr:Putative homogentisate phytyltransferase 1, chloroplastic [Glycine soja]